MTLSYCRRPAADERPWNAVRANQGCKTAFFREISEFAIFWGCRRCRSLLSSWLLCHLSFRRFCRLSLITTNSESLAWKRNSKGSARHRRTLRSHRGLCIRAKPKVPRTGSKKKRGGQPGHQKYERPLISTEDCTSVVTVKPKDCRRCGTMLMGTDKNPLRHQVWELPEIQPIITEYQQHRLTSPCCRESTCASLPAGVPSGQSDPHLVAFTATLMAHFRQNKRRAALFISSVLNIPCCPSLTIKHQHIATQALRKTYEELVQALIDRGNHQVKRLGHDLMQPVKELFRQCGRCRDGTISRRQLQGVLSPVRNKVNALL